MKTNAVSTHRVNLQFADGSTATFLTVEQPALHDSATLVILCSDDESPSGTKTIAWPGHAWKTVVIREL